MPKKAKKPKIDKKKLNDENVEIAKLIEHAYQKKKDVKSISTI